jgi:hypothetical protein
MNNAARVLPNLEALHPSELKELLLALHEQVFSHRKQIATQQQEILSQREQLASRDADTTGPTLQSSKTSGGPTKSWDDPKTARATVSPI